MQKMSFDDYKKMPWKNGLGTTYEVIISPLGSSLQDLNFDFRISMAEVETENQFSIFTGYKRLLTVLNGEGITFNEDSIKRLEVKHFDGELSVLSRPLANEKILDLGVIYNPQKIEAIMEVIEDPTNLKHLGQYDRCYFVDPESLEIFVFEREEIYLSSRKYICIGLKKKS